MYAFTSCNTNHFDTTCSCCTGEGEFPRPKRSSTHHRPSQVDGQLQQAGNTNSAGIEIPGLDMATTSSTFVHALKSVVCRSSQEASYARLWNFTLFLNKVYSKMSLRNKYSHQFVHAFCY